MQHGTNTVFVSIHLPDDPIKNAVVRFFPHTSNTTQLFKITRKDLPKNILGTLILAMINTQSLTTISQTIAIQDSGVTNKRIYRYSLSSKTTTQQQQYQKNRDRSQRT
jgi:hypothetical protein